MEEDKSPPPAKKPKVDDSIEDEGAKAVAPDPVDNQNQQPTDGGGIARSPITVPMLVPEMWEKAFGFLPSSDLVTILNTCPEWNHLLTSQKPTILLPNVLELMSVHLPWKDFLACRLVNKACKAGIDLAYPEIPQAVEAHQRMVEEMVEAREIFIRLMQSGRESLVLRIYHFILQPVNGNVEEEGPHQENYIHNVE